MYGCYDGVLIYGILDENRDRTANRDFLEAHGVSHFAADVVKNYCGNSIYGVALSLSDILDKSKDYCKAEKTLAAFAKVLARMIGPSRIVTSASPATTPAVPPSPSVAPEQAKAKQPAGGKPPRMLLVSWSCCHERKT